MKKLSLLFLIMAIFYSPQSIAQNQTINGVLTVNTPGVNTIRVENDVAGEEASIRLRSKANNGMSLLHSDISLYATGTNTGFLGFKVPHNNSFGTGYDLVINNSGNVGIGTISPNSRLTIEGDGTTIGSAAINFKHAGNGMSIGLSTESNNLMIGDSWNPESSAHLTILNGSGKVGIGTSNPNSTLQIGDSDNTGYPSSETEIKRLSIAPVTHSGSDWFFTSRDNSYANLDIGYSSNKTLTLRHDGNVGIGTTTPDSKLSVNGNIRAHEIKLETSNWPDYVFGENYRQLSLEQVKTFIKEHGHLPGLKSAEVYEKEGVNMMELNQKLLEKIEELTLHTISQEDQIKEQANKIQKMEKELGRLGQLEKELEVIKLLIGKDENN